MAGFDVAQFQAAKFEPRVETVPLPALADFFPEGSDCAFVIRALTANELQKANDAATRLNALDGVVKAIASKKDQIDAIRKALGLSQDTPAEVAKRIEMLVHGCVEPKLTHADVVKLSTVFPVEFYDLSNRVLVLTGQGGSRVKQ